MSDNLTGLIASANRRRRAAVLIFASVVGLAALFPHNDRAMWVPEREAPFVFTAVPEKLPITYLTIGGTDTLLNRLLRDTSGAPERNLRSRFIPSDPRDVAPQSSGGNGPTAAVPQFEDMPTQLAQAPTAPGGILNPGSSSGGNGPGTSGRNPGVSGGGPVPTSGTVNPDPVADPPVDEPPVDEPPVIPPIFAPVPEPLTWAMFIFGFAMVGSALRRRRKTFLA
ncbi:PEPxxWA-CTERM sorting domain-containing protein [Parasphingorhabdus sp.]|uniref:PEPxxWA-CTERM sorting domain-containing protein n=1 Tax=Parasphingorhabdus sp. TaxID=2709688 RepID=UPI003BB100D3